MSLQVGKYQLLDRIGSGGMAEIHLARVTGAAGFEKLVVVKRLLPDLAEEKEFVAQFIDEARLAATFSHANIVTTFDFGEADGNYYIAMEYVEGKNLRRIADSLEKRGKKIPEPAAVHIIAEACRGLDYAHQRKDSQGRVMGVVHRDVSPQNIVVSYSGDVKVLDFGIAKSAAREFHTAAGIVKGKLRYMAPEQVTGDPIDGRADLFAAAVVLWELLYGRRVMPDLPDTDLVEWVQKGEFILPPTVDARWEIDTVLAKALSVNPDERYKSCAEFATALQRFNIQQWPDFTSHDVGRLLTTEFEEDARREREWISHILGQMAKGPQVQVEVSLPMSMRAVEAPSRDDIPTTATPSKGAIQSIKPPSSIPTMIKPLPMEPDSGNTISGLHLKGKSNPSIPAPPGDRGANTEVSLPMVRGTPVDTLGPSPTTAPPAGNRKILFAGVAAGFVITVSGVLFSGVLGGAPEATPTPAPTITPFAASSPTPPETSAPATPTPGPEQTAVAVSATPRPTPIATKRPATPTPAPTEAATPRVASAFLSVNVSSGWAAVYIDGKMVKADTPLVGFAVPAGKHVVTIVKNGKKRSETVVLRAGEQRKLLLDPP